MKILTMMACALAMMACDEDLEAATVDESEAALELAVARAGAGRGGGVFQNPVVHPATAEPVVYRQFTLGETSGNYGAAWTQMRDLGYHPAGLNAAPLGAGARYTGLWHRDDRVLDWSSHRNLSDAEYLALWNERIADGYRVLDLDAHTVGGQTRYHVIFVLDQSPKKWKSHRRLSLASLESTIADYGALGYRPTRVQGYAWGDDTRFAAVFVKDGKTDFITRTNLTSQTFPWADAVYRGQGYVPYDIGPYDTADGALNFTGLWVRADASVLDHRVKHALTAATLNELNETYTKQNLVLVDVDGYSVGGDMRFSAVWHRSVSRQTVQSNRPIGGNATLLVMGATLAEFSTPGADGRAGTMGFFVQDLQTGDYVSMNMHEPGYMASTSKVLIGARVVSHDNIDVAGGSRMFNSTDWRGEANRGFTQIDLGVPQPLQRFFTNMLVSSDTASTDVLYGLLRANDGPTGLDDWLRDVVGLQNVGEVTDICEVDRRISAASDSCVNNVSCDTFEAWFRGNVLWNATPAETNCLNGLPADHRSVENHEDSYTTLANTITPAEFGRFWSKFAAGDLMDNADRATFLATIDPSFNDGFNGFENISYQAFGTKNGGKRRVASQVGFMWDWNGANGDYTDITPRYSFAFFAEDWNFEDILDADNDGTLNDTDWARTAMRSVLSSSLNFLQQD